MGKTENVVISNRDPLDMKTDVKQVFIEGREVPMTNRQTELRDRTGSSKDVQSPASPAAALCCRPMRLGSDLTLVCHKV